MADEWLRGGGVAAIKVFQGQGYDQCLQSMRSKFRSAFSARKTMHSEL